MAGKSIPKTVEEEILALHRGGATVRSIEAQLGGRAKKSRIAEVVRDAKAGANAAKPPRSPKAPPPSSPALPASAAPAVAPAETEPPTLGPSAVDDEGKAAAAALAALDDAQRRLHVLLNLTDRRMASELEKPSPDMALIGKLFAQSRQVRDEVLRIRPPTVRRPEDDPANVEAARVVVATLRARLAAAQAAA